VLQEKKKNKSGVSIFYSVHHRHHHFGSIIKKKKIPSYNRHSLHHLKKIISTTVTLTVVYNIFLHRINITTRACCWVKCVFVYRPSSRERLVARADYNQPPSLPL
jgi:hypothetical protein